MKIIIVGFIIWFVLVLAFMSLFKAAARADKFMEEHRDDN